MAARPAASVRGALWQLHRVGDFQPYASDVVAADLEPAAIARLALPVDSFRGNAPSPAAFPHPER
jgi:hypothetical protein